MKCNKCGIELKEYLPEVETGDHFYHAKDELLFSMVSKYKIPFFCKECGSLEFKYKPLRDIVFVWPDVIPEKVGSIIVPSTVESLQTEYGVIIGVGQGFYSKKGILIKPQIKVGDYIVYDKGVPWMMEVRTEDGKSHHVKYMGAQDVKGVVTDDPDNIDDN